MRDKSIQEVGRKDQKKIPETASLAAGGSLYVSEPVMEICKDHGWDYLVRFKDGSILSIAEEYQAIPEKWKK